MIGILTYTATKKNVPANKKAAAPAVNKAAKVENKNVAPEVKKAEVKDIKPADEPKKSDEPLPAEAINFNQEVLAKLLTEINKSQVQEYINVNGILSFNIKDSKGKVHKFVTKHKDLIVVPAQGDEEKQKAYQKQVTQLEEEVINFLMDILIDEPVFDGMTKNILSDVDMRYVFNYLIENEVYDKKTNTIKAKYKKVMKDFPKFYIVNFYILNRDKNGYMLKQFVSPNSTQIRELLNDTSKFEGHFQESIHKSIMLSVIYSSLVTPRMFPDDIMTQQITKGVLHLPGTELINKQVQLLPELKVEYPNHSTELPENLLLHFVVPLAILNEKMNVLLSTMTNVEGLGDSTEKFKDMIWNIYLKKIYQRVSPFGHYFTELTCWNNMNGNQPSSM